MFDPSGKRGKTIEKRREEHKARRGVKGAKVPAYKVEEVEVDEAMAMKPSNMKKKAKLGAALDRLQALKVAKKKKEMGEEIENEGMQYGIFKGDGKPKGAMAAFGKKEKAKNLAKNTPDEQHTTTTSEAANPAQQAAIAINMKKKGKKPKDMNEEGLRAWFGKSRSKDGKPGWVQVVSGKPCACLLYTSPSPRDRH